MNVETRCLAWHNLCTTSNKTVHFNGILVGDVRTMDHLIPIELIRPILLRERSQGLFVLNMGHGMSLSCPEEQLTLIIIPENFKTQFPLLPSRSKIGQISSIGMR